MAYLKRLKNWLDSPITDRTDREVAARTRERVAALRKELVALEVERERRGDTKRDPLYLQEVDKLTDQIDYELQRGLYQP